MQRPPPYELSAPASAFSAVSASERAVQRREAGREYRRPNRLREDYSLYRKAGKRNAAGNT